MGARLPVPSKLRDYDDFVVCYFLEFVCPVGLNCESSFSTDQFSCNHKGATHSSSAVDSSVELESSAVISPVLSPTVILPLNSVPKPQPSEQRMILDLSWPIRASNDAILDHVYLSQPYSRLSNN